MQSFKQSLTDANIEIYGEEASTLRIAERHRFHLMDSGVEARLSDVGVSIVFALRAERSDFPHAPPALIFERIRDAHAADLSARDYVGHGERIVDIHDPVDSEKVLDVWYEVEFSKHVEDAAIAVDEIRWALTVDKYVKPA